MANLEAQFEQAAKDLGGLTRRPPDDDLLMAYGLYKQATEGDATGERPGGFDFKGRAKYDAWTRVKGLSREDAMKRYVKLVTRLKAAFA